MVDDETEARLRAAGEGLEQAARRLRTARRERGDLAAALREAAARLEDARRAVDACDG